MEQSRTPWRRPLILGASGQVGAEFCRELKQGGVTPLVSTTRAAPTDGSLTLDLARLLTVEDVAAVLEPTRPDLILCAGAMTFVDGCEADPERASRINTYGPSALAAYASRQGIPFVYFSSDYVFDGTPEHPGPYSEDANTHPLNVYGRTKLQGEQAVLRVHPGALIVRTSWVYGPDAAGKNFISSMLRQLRAGQAMRVPSDQISTPTFNRDLAQVTLQLAAAGAGGVVHVTGPEMMSRLELAHAVADFFKLDSGLLEGVPTRELGQTAARPLFSGLVSTRLQGILPKAGIRSLREGLEETAASLGR